MELVKRGLKSPFVIVYVILSILLIFILSGWTLLAPLPMMILGGGTAGVLSLMFYAMNKHRGWLILTSLMWLVAGMPILAINFLNDQFGSIDSGISALFLMGAGSVGTIAIQRLRQHARQHSQMGWNPLGLLNSGDQRIDNFTPSQRDHAPINKR